MKAFFFTLTVFLTSPSFAEETKIPPLAAASTPAAAQESNELSVGVKGMVCAFCAQGIEKKFRAQKEVESLQVSLENKVVKIKFKKGQRLSNEKIAEALKSAGYEADFGGKNDSP